MRMRKVLALAGLCTILAGCTADAGITSPEATVQRSTSTSPSFYVAGTTYLDTGSGWYETAEAGGAVSVAEYPAGGGAPNHLGTVMASYGGYSEFSAASGATVEIIAYSRANCRFRRWVIDEDYFQSSDSTLRPADYPNAQAFRVEFVCPEY